VDNLWTVDQVNLTRSTDGGATWSSPFEVAYTNNGSDVETHLTWTVPDAIGNLTKLNVSSYYDGVNASVIPVTTSSLRER